MSEFISVDYNQLKCYLECYTGVFLFVKKDGSQRVMLATRNKSTIQSLTGLISGGILAGHDKRNSSKTNTISVIDLVLAEPRAIPADRLLGVYWFGVLNSQNCGPAYDYLNQTTKFIRQQEQEARNRKQQELLQRLETLSHTGTENLTEEERINLESEINEWVAKS